MGVLQVYFKDKGKPLGLIWIHHVDPEKQYALVGDDAYNQRGLFKVDLKDLEVDEKELDAYLLVQVEKKR